jgi:hypothetical protein
MAQIPTDLVEIMLNSPINAVVEAFTRVPSRFFPLLDPLFSDLIFNKTPTDDKINITHVLRFDLIKL